MDLKEHAKTLKQNIPTVFYVWKDRETPLCAKLLAAVTVGYALSPIDLIPDFIPVLGYLDDVILLPILIALTIRAVPKDIWEKNRSLAADLWRGGRPKKWYFALPIVVVWLLLIRLVVKAVFLP